MSDNFDTKTIESIDTGRVFETYRRWPSLAREGFSAALSPPRVSSHRVYFLGMGGSASGGDIVASWLLGEKNCEMTVYKGSLPTANLEGSLAIACSVSGDTQETLAMLRGARAQGASPVSISAGGRLREEAKRMGIPHVEMPRVLAPRYSLPFIIFSTLGILKDEFDLDLEAQVKEALSLMDDYGEALSISSPTEQNPAKSLARRLARSTPVIYGTRATRGVGVRFKNVLNENAKMHAIYDGIPDAFHNDVESWEDPNRTFIPVFLRHLGDDERTARKAGEMIDILKSLGTEPVEVKGRGILSLSQLVTMVYQLDMTSYYSAIARGVNPLPVDLIDRLKKSP